jgi:diguanylate cyclase (GGDEF)-like protein
MPDALTHLRTRREAEEQAEMLVESAQTLSALSIDIDCCKGLNAIAGHQRGDRAIVEIARRIVALVGESGFVARVGGDEFIVVLPDMGAEAALTLAHSMRRAINYEPVLKTATPHLMTEEESIEGAGYCRFYGPLQDDTYGVAFRGIRVITAPRLMNPKAPLFVSAVFTTVSIGVATLPATAGYAALMSAADREMWFAKAHRSWPDHLGA